MSEDQVRNCGCGNFNSCGGCNKGCGIFGGSNGGCDCTILFFIIVFLLLFCGCGNNNSCGCC